MKLKFEVEQKNSTDLFSEDDLIIKFSPPKPTELLTLNNMQTSISTHKLHCYTAEGTGIVTALTQSRC